MDKEYDMVPRWITESLDMFGIEYIVQEFLNNSMKSWNFNESGEKLGNVDIRRGILQDNSLSPLFVLCMT